MWINLRAFLTEGNFGSCLMLLWVQFSRHAALGRDLESGWECQRVDGVGQSESVAVFLAVR